MRTVKAKSGGQDADNDTSVRHGFTIVELIAVLVLLSLVAGTVVFSLRGNVANSRAELAIEKLQLVDRQLRDSASRSGRASSLRFDVSRGKVARSVRGARDLVIEDDIPVLRFRSKDLDADGGQVAVQFLPDGTSPTYAVCLRQNGQARKWIIFAGLTGQALVTSDAGEVEQLLRR